ncbi:MAG: DUF3368 domain-containing protein [uncultured Thiotrichaceae bacterium]|uniref:DUF3368 domain-containing protein n=1 Tax=uncultured Thiotrichaceae bacterium TaxID=298394 RepID=A0A6S6SE08_9GAMM|nr:MAG: DUF3368 domain-containing protein [uncultured Thiotrichaceae bacterium]
MRTVIVADTGPLIALAKIDQLSLLSQLYQTITLPETVFLEATKDNAWQDAMHIHNFVQQYAKVVPDQQTQTVKDLFLRLDAGESQALALADSLHCPVLLDERRGRVVAKQMKLEIVGTLGLLITAKQEGLVPGIGSLLNAMSNNGYRLSPALIQQALEIAGEA